MEFEVWGAAELDQSKLSNAAYWVDAANPAGTFKADWVYLGRHYVERLDKKNASVEERVERGRYGNQFIFESTSPVRYIRFYNRAPGAVYGSLNFYAIGELSFYGYGQ